MKAKTILILALCVVFTAHAQTKYSETEAVLKTAKAQLNNFIKDLPDESLADYGFSGKQEFRKITFGEPIPIFTLNDTAVVFTSTWRVPIVIDKEYRSLLTVIQEEGVFRAVDFGACELAKAYAANKTPKTTGMLRVYEIRKDFLIEGSEKGSQAFIPIEFTR